MNVSLSKNTKKYKKSVISFSFSISLTLSLLIILNSSHLINTTETTNDSEALCEIKVFKTNFHDINNDYVQSTIFFKKMKMKINKEKKELHFIWNYETPKDLEKTHEIIKIVESKGKNNESYFDMTKSDDVFSIKFSLLDKIELIMYHRSDEVGDAYYLKFHKGLSPSKSLTSSKFPSNNENEEEKNNSMDSLPLHNHKQSDFELKFIVSPQDANINVMRNIFSEFFNKKLE